MCGLGGDCEKVQTSEWADLAGVPVALLGLLGYAAILATLFVEREEALVAGALFALAGFGFSAYLTYRELFSIDAICPWCVCQRGDHDPARRSSPPRACCWRSHRPTRCGTLRRVKKTSLYLDPDLDEALARRAADEGLTKAEFIRRTLAGAMQKPRRPKPQASASSRAADGRRRRERRATISPRRASARIDASSSTPASSSRSCDAADRRPPSGVARWIETHRRGPRHHAARRRRDGPLRRPRAAATTPRRAVAATSTPAPTPSAGGRTRSTRRSRSPARHPWIGLDRRLARRARRPASHATASRPSTDHFRSLTTPDGEPFVVAPRRRLKRTLTMPDHPELLRRPRHPEGGRSRAHDLPPRRAAVEVRRRAAAVRAQGAAREPAAHRGQRLGRARPTSRRSRRWDAKAEPSEEIAFTPARVRACRTSPACPPSSTSPRCATRWPTSAATRRRSTRSCPPSSSSTTRCRSTTSARATPSRSTPSSSSSATRSATRSCAGARTRSTTSRSCRPTPGIVHQVNLEYLARVVFVDDATGDGLPRHARRHRLAHDDDQRPRRARLGRRRHRGRGRDARPADVDADPAGRRLQARTASCPRARPRPTSCSPSPRCCARRASSASSSSSTAPGVVAPAARRPRDDRQHGPEYGATCAIFPVDAETLRYLRVHRPPEGARSTLVEAYAKEQGLWHDEHAEEPTFTDTLELDLGDGRAVARRARSARRTACRCTDAQGRVPRGAATAATTPRASTSHDEAIAESFPASDPPAIGAPGHERAERAPHHGRRRPRSPSTRPRAESRCDGDDVRARPRLRRDRRDHALHEHLEPVGDARRRPAGAATRVARGLTRKPWVKTSLAPGLEGRHRVPRRAPGCTEPLEALGFNLVGYGCTTCIGNSGPLPDEISRGGRRGRPRGRARCCRGNRNFEGRINPDVKMNYLASPPLVVAYALAGTMDIDLVDDPLGDDADGKPTSTCATSGPPSRRSPRRSSRPCSRTCSARATARSSTATSAGTASTCRPATASPGTTSRPTCTSRRTSRACRASPTPVEDIEGARVLAMLGDSVTTDHISPAGSIKEDSPAGRYLHGARRRSRATSTPTARGAATTR